MESDSCLAQTSGIWWEDWRLGPGHTSDSKFQTQETTKCTTRPLSKNHSPAFKPLSSDLPHHFKARRKMAAIPWNRPKFDPLRKIPTAVPVFPSWNGPMAAMADTADLCRWSICGSVRESKVVGDPRQGLNTNLCYLWWFMVPVLSWIFRFFRDPQVKLSSSYVIPFHWNLPLSLFQAWLENPVLQDFPVDSCACHIFYEHWVQMQLVISKVPLGLFWFVPTAWYT